MKKDELRLAEATTSVRGRSKSVGRGQFFTTDRPVDFRPTGRKIDQKQPKFDFFRNFSVSANFFRQNGSISRKNFGRISTEKSTAVGSIWNDRGRGRCGRFSATDREHYFEEYIEKSPL